MAFKAYASALLLLALGLSGTRAKATPASFELATQVYARALHTVKSDEMDELVRLWYLSNQLAAHGADAHHSFMRSLLWYATDRQGLCPDNLAADDHGDGLWPLVMHNYLARHGKTRFIKERELVEFEDLRRGRQTRGVSWDARLTAEEIAVVKLQRRNCLDLRRYLDPEQKWTWFKAETVSPNERAAAMRSYLQRYLATHTESLDAGSLAVLRHRLADIDLYLAQSETDKQAAEQKLRAMATSVDALAWSGLTTVARSQLIMLVGSDEKQGATAKTQLLLSYLRFEVDLGRVELWSLLWAHLGKTTQSFGELFTGPLGEDVLRLALARDYGDAGVIAAHSGVFLLQRGDWMAAISKFSLANKLARHSQHQNQIDDFVRLWMQYLFRQYRLEERLVSLIDAGFSEAFKKALWSDLVWESALFHDKPYLGHRLDLTRRPAADGLHLEAWRQLLANGQVATLARQLGSEAHGGPRAAKKFASEVVRRLESLPSAVVASNQPLLQQLRAYVLDPRTGRKPDRELLAKLDALLDGIGASPSMVHGNLKQAGVLHLGGSQIMPLGLSLWPFTATEGAAMDVFRPLQLKLSQSRPDFAGQRWQIGNP